MAKTKAKAKATPKELTELQKLQKEAGKAKIPIAGTESVEILKLLLLSSRGETHDAELKKMRDDIDRRVSEVAASERDLDTKIKDAQAAEKKATDSLDIQSEESQALLLQANTAVEAANKAQQDLSVLMNRKKQLDSNALAGISEAALLSARNQKAKKNPNIARSKAKLKAMGRTFTIKNGVKIMTIDKLARKNYNAAKKAAKKASR